MQRLRAVFVLILVGVIVYGTAAATLTALRPAAFGAQARSPVPASALPMRIAKHVLFVVVDGLRWDVAHDPSTMPRFAHAMRQHISAEIWSSPISMTSSAVLAYGTGQRASLDQVLENLRPPTLHANSWLQNAHAAGLSSMGAGDPVWAQLYGKYLRDFRADPVTVAIEHDFNARTFREARELLTRAPDFLVVHFVTPDHQGHAYGIRSERYRQGMREFDRALFDWLDMVPKDWTVLVTSDHGAAETGTHGTDTAEQRRSPIFAFGPGIAKQPPAPRALDQVELPGLFAALLGVANAEQSRGAALLDWLDVNPLLRRQWACTEIERLSRQPLGGQPAHEPALACCNSPRPQADCVSEARRLATSYDSELSRHEGTQSHHGWRWLAVVLISTLAVPVVLWGKRSLPVAASLAGWLICSLLLTVYVERLPGVLPNMVRGTLFFGTNLLLVLGAIGLRRSHCGRDSATPRRPITQGRWALVLGIAPGWLLVSYPVNTQVEAYCVTGVLAALIGAPRLRQALRVKPTTSLLSWRNTGASALILASLMALALVGTKPSDVRPLVFASDPRAALLLVGAVVLIGVLRALPAIRVQHRMLLVLVPLCLALQHLPLHAFGRAGWLLTTLAALAAACWRRRDAAFLCAIASYAWVARDYEWLILIPALLLADAIGRAAHKDPLSHGDHLVPYIVHVTFLFALSYLLRIGLQGGLQLETLDVTVGAFGDPALPVWVSAVLLSYKFLLPQVLLLSLYLRHQRPGARVPVLFGVAAAHLARNVCLLLMLFFCGQSYWTAFRVVADLPFALVAVFGVMLALVVNAFPAPYARVKPGTGW